MPLLFQVKIFTKTAFELCTQPDTLSNDFDGGIHKEKQLLPRLIQS
jgi:hypothetical protein